MMQYSFRRPLTQTEWDILRSYTCRVRSIRDFESGLHQKSLRIFPNLPLIESLFPNLRYLGWEYKAAKITPLLHLPHPSLISFSFITHNPNTPRDCLEVFPGLSPNITSLTVHATDFDATFNKSCSDCICQWHNLQTVICPRITLDADALEHLSRMPGLTRLHFAPGATSPDFNSPLWFSNLRHLILRCISWKCLLQLLSHIRLPAITEFCASVHIWPSRPHLSFLLTSVQASGAGDTIQVLRLLHNWSPVARSQGLLLGLDDLRPCMKFTNLRHINIDIGWDVGLSDRDVLSLASAWPHLEKFHINFAWGWNTLRGITPNALLQLLRTCRSLHLVALALDTRGYTVFPQSQENLGLVLTHAFSINVLDSAIEAESVPALAALFAGIAACPKFSLSSWDGYNMKWSAGGGVYKGRWENVYRQAKDASSQRS